MVLVKTLILSRGRIEEVAVVSVRQDPAFLPPQGFLVGPLAAFRA